MKRSSALSGLIGLILLSFGTLGYVLTSGGFARLFIFVNLLGGLIAVVGWLMSSWARWERWRAVARRVMARTRRSIRLALSDC